MSNRGRDYATQLVVVELPVDFTKQILLPSAHEQATEQRKRNNCNRHSQDLERSQLSNRGRDYATQLVVVELPVDFTKQILLPSAHEQATEQRKQDNCNRHSQVLERSQLSDRGWDRANQLVVVELPVDSQSTQCYYQYTNTDKETAQTRQL